MDRKKIAKSYAINLLAVILVFAVLAYCIYTKTVSRYIAGIFTLVCINIILAVSLNITTGCLGQIALGHAGFMSVGAYVAAIFTKSMMLPGYAGFFVSLLLGGVFAAVIGIIIGAPALRLRGDYLAIITLAFGEIIRVIIEYLHITGGAQGLTGIKHYSNFYNAYWVMAISVFLMYTVMKSRHGRAVLAIREDDIASEASGIHNTFYRTFAFTLSAFFAGVAGALYAHHIGILGAKTFDFNRSIEILVIVVLGGLGSFTGSIVSAFLLTVLPEFLRQFSDYRMLVYALALIVMMIYRPKGLLGRAEFSFHGAAAWLQRLRAHFNKRKPDEKGGSSS